MHKMCKGPGMQRVKAAGTLVRKKANLYRELKEGLPNRVEIHGDICP